MIRSVLSPALRRRKHRASLLLSRRNHHHAVVAATAVGGDEASSSGNAANWIFLASAVAFASTTTTAASWMVTTTRCDDDDDDDDDDVEEDPYDKLPEEDEATNCSICQTYRQGPCRPYWRKVEACTKEHELKKEDDDVDDDDKEEKKDDTKEEETKKHEDTKDIEDDDDNNTTTTTSQDPPCLKYMMPWIDCATSYRNLYNFIEMDMNYTLGIVDLEKEATQTLCWAPGYEPKVDWSPWQQYVEEHEDWKPPKKKTTKPTTATPLWKSFDYQSKGDPELCQMEAIVPMMQGDSGVLECAYAVDQGGNVIGFVYGKKPSEVASLTASKKDDDDDKPEVVELKIRILPSLTRSVTIAASYTQLPNNKKEEAEGGAKEEGGEKEKEDHPLESHVYKTRSYSLQSMAKKKKNSMKKKKKVS